MRDRKNLFILSRIGKARYNFINPKKNMKTSLLNALQSLFVVSIGAFVGLVGFAAPAAAAAPFEDNFDSYSTGDLTGQGGWTIDGNAYVVLLGDGVIPPVSSPNLLQIYAYSNSIKKTGDSLADGQVYISWWNNGGEDGKVINIRNTAETLIAGSLQVQNAGFIARGTWVDYDFPDNQWIRMGIEWRSSDWSVRYYIEGYGYTDWAVNSYWAAAPTETFSQIYLIVSGGSFFDSISDSVSTIETISGYAPILTPTLPERNAESIVDFDAGFEVSGSVEIPTANTHAYNKLMITFRKPDSFFPAKTLSINLGNLTGGQSVNYLATTTIPITTSGVNFFKVGYALTGSTYAGSYADNPPISEDMLAFDNTWVKDSVEDAPAYLITPSIKPEQDAMEDCGAYSGIDAVVCNFKNFIVGAFLPTDDALAQIGGTMDALKNKFPMNYASAISNTFSTITAGVDDDAGFSISLLGHTGAIDTSFFTQDIGGGATLGALIKLVLTFLVFMIFLYWGIGYMHRILNK